MTVTEQVYTSDGIPLLPEPADDYGSGGPAEVLDPDTAVEKLVAEPERRIRKKAVREHIYSLARSGADYETVQDHRDALIEAGLIGARAFESALNAARGDAPKPARRRTGVPGTATPVAVSLPGRDGKEVHRGQLRWALRFVDRYRGQFIHTPGRGWFEWAGSHWKFVPRSPNTLPAPVARAVLSLVRAAFFEMPDLSSLERDELMEDISKAEYSSGVSGIISLAATMNGIARNDDELDTHPDLFVCRNGTYELLTDTFRPSRPEDLITRVAGCDYDPKATCPTYDAAMARWQPNSEMRDYIHRIGGSSLQGRLSEQTLPVFYGKGGNGKGSTLNDSWLPVFGDYGKVVGIEVLMSNPKGESFLPQKAALAGSRLIVTSEPERGMRFNAGTLKLLTGGNPIDARALYQAPMNIKPTWQIIMECNTRPTPPADDDAVWRRLRQVGWNTSIPEKEWGGPLPQKLADELPGILNRLLEGWRDYRDNGGIRMPDNVRTATKEWRDEVDIHGQFLAECCWTGQPEHVWTASSVLFARWARWCKANGEDSGSNKTFTETLKRREEPGVMWKRSNGAKWFGLMLQSEVDPDDLV